jgi:ACS family glucarate transporter-like MFS transporter
MSPSPAGPAPDGLPARRATHVRYALLGVATLNAFLLYLDRICMSTVVHSPSFTRDVGLSENAVGTVLSAFFMAYALGQLPAGFLADRFGPRRMLVSYIILWSACTALTGFAGSFALLMAARLACGLAEAGAYPASARVIARWFPFGQRARANSAVSFGGRFGGAIAPWLTVTCIAALGAWRPVLWLYGGAGLALAAATYVLFRDEPAAHPWTNDAERELIRDGRPPPPPPTHHFPWKAMLQHRGLWFLNLASAAQNFGWALLVTWLPKYLQSVRGLSDSQANYDTSLALSCGMAGILFGGWWCDALTRWLGPVLGRRLPMVFGSLAGVLAYLLCPHLPTLTGLVIACGLVAFATDSAGPATWALGQDIGRNYVGATLAWSNMWGNLGAAALAWCIPRVLSSPAHRADWSEIFWLCAGAFLIAGVSIFGVDSTKPLTEDA